MNEFPNRLAVHSKRFSLAAAVFVTLVGVFVLTGWLLNIQGLKSGFGQITMKPNAALALLLAGVSLWLLNSDQTKKTLYRAAAQSCAAIVALLGALTLSEHIFGWNLGIDEFLFTEPAGALATASPGRMGLNASTCFTLAGVALLLFHREHAISVSQVLSIIVSLLALLAIIGYAFQVEELYGLAAYSGIALHTAVSLFVLSLGLLLSRSSEGMISVISSDRAGGVMARQMLVVAVAGPFVLGWLRLLGQRTGHYDLGFGTALLVLAIIIIFSAAVWRSAAKVDHFERERREAVAGEELARARLKDIMERISDGFIALDNDWRYTYINEQGAQMLRKSRADLLGKAIWHVFPEAVSTETYVQFNKAKIEQRLTHFEQFYEPLNTWFEINVYPSPDGVSVFYRDITARKRIEEEREHLLERAQAARAQAEGANRLKDEFLATVSHELRTPLNAVLGWATMLSSRKLDDGTARHAIQTIERNARSQAQLVEDLLDVSRIISGKLRLEVKPVELTSVIQGAIDSIAPAAAAKEIQLQMILDPAVSHIHGDATRLQQIVWNLLANAVKFTGKGGLVQVKLDRVDSRAQISVSDTGEGISSAFLPYVFDRFQQADGATTRRHGGLGLGLAIARHLVEMHGGTIVVESPGEGQGSTFTVRLPVQSDPGTNTSWAGELELATSAGEEISENQAASSLMGLRIMAVDDEPDTRDLIKGVLEHSGADVLTVGSARDALDALPGWKPDVLICDIGMPDEDGYTLIHKIRKLQPEQGGNTPAIALTGYVRIEERVRALDAGYQMFVPKPVEADELTAIIGSLVRRAYKD